MITQDFNTRTALLMAAVCGQTYHQFLNSDGVHLVPRNYRIAAAFQAKLMDGSTERFGFILESEDSLIVAFRGTVSPVDWVTDFVATQKKYPFVRDAGWTHQGFTDVYSSLRTPVLSVLNELPTRNRLYVTGHSLGGALATLCAIDLAANSNYVSPIVYTFGSPRVGDSTFVKAYGSRAGRTYRVYNVNDVVTQLPTVLYKSPRTGAVYHYQHVKTGRQLTFRGNSVSANHVISGYFAELSKSEPAYARELCRSNPGLCP